MCSTCGCGQPFNKHGEKKISTTNQKYADPKIKFKASKPKTKKK